MTPQNHHTGRGRPAVTSNIESSPPDGALFQLPDRHTRVDRPPPCHVPLPSDATPLVCFCPSAAGTVAGAEDTGCSSGGALRNRVTSRGELSTPNRQRINQNRMSTTPTDDREYDQPRDENGRFLKPGERVSTVTKNTVYVGHDSELRTGSAEVVDRFHDVKESLRRRESFEVTNEHVMSVLLDLYWIHYENGGEGS